MKQHWTSSSVAIAAFLLVAPAILFARDPKPHDPCRDLRADLDDKVNTLHKSQNDELNQCRQANGKNADVCRELKKQQQLDLNQLRGYRQAEMSNCGPDTNFGAIEVQSDEFVNEYYVFYLNYPHPAGRFPERPYRPRYPKDPKKNPPVGYKPKDTGSGKRTSNQNTRASNAGHSSNSGSSSASSHSSGRSSGSSSSGSSGSSGGSRSSSGSGYSGSSGSSSSGSRSSGSSGSSGGSSSGSSSGGSRPR